MEISCTGSFVFECSDIAKDLLKAHDIDRKAMEDFIDSHLVEKAVGLHNPIKRNKRNTIAACEVKKKLTSSQNEISQMRVERNVFGQLVLLSIEHNVDLELTLSFPLRHVPWSLSTPDGMPTKTVNSKLLYFLESYIEPTFDRPSSAAHIIDVNAILQSLTAIFLSPSRNRRNQYATSY